MGSEKVAGMMALLEAELRQQLSLSVASSQPGDSRDPWYIDVSQGSYRVTVEYSPELDLFGLSTNRTMGDSCEELYHYPDEVLTRVVEMAQAGAHCSPGTISHTAYAWACTILIHATQGSPAWRELSAIVEMYEKKP